MPAKIVLRLVATALACAATAALGATAQVEFVKPESFSDAGRGYAPRERAENLEMLRRHLVEQAARKLPQDQVLGITVTDVDLAGSFEPWQRASSEVRIVKDIYPPRIDLRFRLVGADGSVVKEGSRSLRDNGFMMGTSRYLNDAFRYEKTLLDDWLDGEFGQRRAAR